MTVDKETYDRLKDLPFASQGQKTPKITQPITFSLKKDPTGMVTLFPIHDANEVPKTLLKVIQQEINYVIEEGATYPYHETMDLVQFVLYWFSAFVAILIDGDHQSLSVADLQDKLETYWKKHFLGTFYVKPNYTGRCSHVCNAGFVVNHEKRGLGLGKEMGAKYLIWGPQLGYVYSVFNLVFETNTASLRIWDSLGFDRIGYVKNVAVLKGQNNLVGAYMYGKDLV